MSEPNYAQLEANNPHLDKDKPYYLRGLKKYQEDKMFLTDTIKYEQDLYEEAAKEFLEFSLDIDDE